VVHKNSDVFSVGAIIMSCISALTLKKNYYDFKEADLFKHVDKIMQSSDLSENSFKLLLPKMLVFNPAERMTACKAYDILSEQKSIKSFLMSKIE